MPQRKSIPNCGGIFDLPAKRADLEKMRQVSAVPDFWNDNAAASSHLKKTSILEKEITLWQKLDTLKGDIQVLMEFGETGDTELEEINVELNLSLIHI